MKTIFGRQSSTTTSEVPVFEGYDVLDHGDLIAIQESYDDQMSIVQHIHAIDSELLVLESDLAALKDGGASDYEVEQRIEEVESVLEASVRGAWDGIKKFFSNLWGKLRAFFDTVVRFFDGIFRSAQGFVKKYEDQLKRLVLDGYKFKMHEYTHLENSGRVPGLYDSASIKSLYDEVFKQTAHGDEGAIARLRSQIEASKDKKDEILNGLRGKMMGASSMTAEEFRQEAFSYFRGGDKNQDDRSEISVDIGKIIAAIKNTEAKKKVDDFAKETDKEFSDVIKKVDALGKAFGESKVSGDNSHTSSVANQHGVKGDVQHNTADRGTVIEGVRTLSSQITAVKDIHLSFFRSWREAWAERDRTYRSVCVHAFSYKKAKA